MTPLEAWITCSPSPSNLSSKNQELPKAGWVLGGNLTGEMGEGRRVLFAIFARLDVPYLGAPRKALMTSEGQVVWTIQ